MLLNLLIALVLVAVTVAIHAIGFSVLLRYMVKKLLALKKSGVWLHTWLIIELAWWLLLIHTAEIVVWGLFYFWQGCMPDLNSAIYFSGVTYTTVGYGDIVLPESWWLLAPSEALSGILMCGLSTGLFFAVVHRLFDDLKEHNSRSSDDAFL
jgi:hypothetical protein